MIGFPYRDGYVVGLTVDDIRLLQPYLKYTDYTFGKLVDNPLVHNDGGMFEFTRTFDLIFRSAIGDRLPRYCTRSGFLEENSDNFYYRMRALQGDPLHSLYLVFSGALCEKFHEELPTTLRANFTTLDKRLPERGESEDGLDTTVEFFQGIATKTTFVTANSSLPGLSYILHNTDWSTIFPTVFLSISDFSGWNTRTDELLRRVGSARKLSPIRLNRIVDLRGTR